MNGPNKKQFALDSCVCMQFLDGRLSALPEGRYFISVMTRMEILADPKHTKQTVENAKNFLRAVTVIPLTPEIERLRSLASGTFLTPNKPANRITDHREK